MRDTDDEPMGQSVSHYASVLRRHCWKMMLFVAVCGGATYYISKHLTPVYESTAVLDVDWEAPMAVVGHAAPRDAAPPDAEQFLTTQIRLVQSDSVLRPVVEKYHLFDAEHRIANKAAVAPHAISQAPISLMWLSVTRPANTYLLTISYRSRDRQLAADVANGIAESYIKTLFALRLKSSADLARFMGQQLSELKRRVDASGQALAVLEKDLNMVNPQDNTNILSARLVQLNGEYTAAQGDRIKKEAVLKLKGALSSALQAQLDEARRRLDESARKYAVIRSTFGTGHPEHQKAKSEFLEVKRQYTSAEERIAEQVRADYEEAKSREAMLQQNVLTTKAEFDELNARFHQYQERKREADADKQIYSELTTKITEAGINSGFQSNAIRIADPARPAAAPVWPKVRLNTALAFMFAGAFAMIVVLLRDASDTTIRDAHKVQRSSGIEVIGALPAIRHLGDTQLLYPMQFAVSSGTCLDAPRAAHTTLGLYAEAVRTLRSTMVLSNSDGRLRSVLVTSASTAEGKTTTAINLAIAHAAQGRKTLIVDADLRQPRVYRRAGLEYGPGLHDVLTGQKTWRETLRTVADIPNLELISGGRPTHSAADMITQRIAGLFDEWAAEFDLVLIDAPSLRGFADPLEMATLADGVLIVSAVGAIRLDAVNQVAEALARVRANVLGIVLNRVDDSASPGSDNYVAYLQNKVV